MSAWKKPSRNAWRRKLWITLRPSAGRSKPFACKRGVVVERRAVDPFQREHFARGAVPVDARHAKVGVLACVFSAISESAAASRRKSISIATERASVATASTGRSRCASSEKSFRLARGEEEGVEIGLETALDAGPQDFDRHRLARAIVVDFGAMHLRDRGGGHGGTETGVDGGQRLVEGGGDDCFRFGSAETAPSCPAGFSRSRAIAVPTTSGRVARNWPSLT